jgi:hypothetical protein
MPGAAAEPPLALALALAEQVSLGKSQITCARVIGTLEVTYLALLLLLPSKCL